jgi:hypothetical protein
VPDEAAAHDLLCELRTRISTQPLPYQYGVEARALESLWEVFAEARAAMKKYPGCAAFARRTTQMLNMDLRPVTAKWHRAHLEGRLNSRDGANEFRADLADVQVKLRAFAEELQQMAYGAIYKDALSPDPVTPEELAEWLADLPFGIVPQPALTDSPVDAINAAEAAAVSRRREKYGLDLELKNAVGLGLSGGGIRSATFCLGAVQVLADRGLLKHVDFLSTVSGGGYTGTFLTRTLGRGKPQTDVAGPYGPDPDPIRYVRQHAKYLSAYDLKRRWGMVMTIFAGMILNWSAPLLMIVLASLAAVFIPTQDIPWAAVLSASSAVTVVCLAVYAIGMRSTPPRGAGLLGLSAAVTLFLAALWLLTRVYAYVHAWDFPWRTAGVLAAVVTAFPSIVRLIPILKKPKVRNLVLKAVLILAGFVVPIGSIALCFWFYDTGSRPLGDLSGVPGWVLLIVLAAVFAFVALFLLDINLTAPHRLYRDLLARTFVYATENETDPAPLAEINPDGRAPYHLINATVNLPSSTSVKLRERKSDFFLFSKHWCGAPSIGYRPTAEWRANRVPVDLATAMAVSGAAVSSYMGLGSMPTLAALLTFLNVRLGYWIRRPDKPSQFESPGFLCLLREMTGAAMSEKEAWINLSDGGHIENMGVYELLRRRCKFIVSIDGEADPQSTFQGHLTLVRHAQIDFGIRIEPDLTDLRMDLTSKYSQSHAMMWRVCYPAAGGRPRGRGLLLYLKLSVTGDELEIIRRYRILHPDFPHQTTLDQFFDEEQFEAYRQLGVHVAEGLFSPTLLGGRRPVTMAEWFGELAKNLLLHEK